MQRTKHLIAVLDANKISLLRFKRHQEEAEKIPEVQKSRENRRRKY